MNEWLLALIALLPAWILQNALHESSHLLVGWIVEGRKPTGLYFWPHTHYGQFYFSRYTSGVATKSGSPTPRFIAPFWAATGWAALSLSLGFVIHVLFFAFTLAALVDALWFWRGYFYGSLLCDGKRYRAERKKEHMR